MNLQPMQDYVFDVDIADGMPTKKLAVDRGENPYDAADRFMEQEGLPTTYRCREARLAGSTLPLHDATRLTRPDSWPSCPAGT